jgi:hypothetical protein
MKNMAADSKPDGRREPVEARYVLNSSGAISFKLGPYDVSRLLVIDPTLTYSTYLGGSGDEFAGATRSLALLGAANPTAYFTGYTDSANFPVTSGAFQPAYGGGTNDSFVADFSFAPPRP